MTLSRLDESEDELSDYVAERNEKQMEMIESDDQNRPGYTYLAELAREVLAESTALGVRG